MTEIELTELINEFADTPYFDKANTWFDNRQHLMYSAEFSNMIYCYNLYNYVITFEHNYNKVGISGSVYRFSSFNNIHISMEIAELDKNELRDFLNEQILNLKIFKRKEKLSKIKQDFEYDR